MRRRAEQPDSETITRREFLRGRRSKLGGLSNYAAFLTTARAAGFAVVDECVVSSIVHLPAAKSIRTTAFRGHSVNCGMPYRISMQTVIARSAAAEVMNTQPSTAELDRIPKSD